MFSLIKYLYYGNQKVKEHQIEIIADNEPEIIDSYVSTSNILSSKLPFITPPPFMEPTIKKSYSVAPNIFPIQKGSLTENVLKKLRTVYLVLKKNTGEPLAICDSLDKAKELGQKATYHNCQILEYRINDPCQYLRYPVFENK